MVVQLNRLTQFRQALYENGFTRRADAQMELLDALLRTPAIRSFPDLSRSPVFRRQWHSLYAALEDGGQDAPYLTSYLTGLVPQAPVTLFVLDESAWPRPDARTLEDRGYVHTATKAIDSAHGDMLPKARFAMLTIDQHLLVLFDRLAGHLKEDGFHRYFF